MKSLACVAMLLPVLCLGETRSLPPDEIVHSENIINADIAAVQDVAGELGPHVIYGYSIESVLVASFPTPPSMRGEQSFRISLVIASGTGSLISMHLLEDGVHRSRLDGVPSDGLALAEGGLPVIVTGYWEPDTLLNGSGSSVEIMIVFGGSPCVGCKPLPFHHVGIASIEWLLSQDRSEH